MSHIYSVAVLGLLGAVAYKLYQRLTRISIAHIPGPEPQSFLLGNLNHPSKGQAVEVEFKWQAQFGDIVKIKGLVGEDQLWVTDPKALQYIFQTSGYSYLKSPERSELSRISSGRGILWADGDVHKRHRKVMLPGFSGLEVKAYLPAFSACAAKVGEKWRDIIASSEDQSSVVNVQPWAARCALDAISGVAFDYQFGAIDSADNVLGKSFKDLAFDTFGAPTDADTFRLHAMGRIPNFLRELIGDYLPSKKLTHTRATAKLVTRVFTDVLHQKTKTYLGKGGRDIMSLIVNAGVSENEGRMLKEDEMVGVMRAILLAGNETTANTLSWMLLELARHPEVQTKLRVEIRAMERTIQGRGDSACTPADLESMRYMNAVVQETLRYHPVALNLLRIAARDDVLPLSKPITTTSGEVITQLPIAKGTRINTPVGVYNRNKDIFGEDADIYNPERWLNSSVKKATSIGVVGNLMSFSSGVRSCIGWKFATLELQAFLFELAGGFEFSTTPECQKIRRESAIVMLPTIEGEVEKGAQLPLRIRVASKDREDEF